MADRVPLDFDPPVRKLRELLLGITDDDLSGLTPSDDWTLGDLLDHISHVVHAFTQRRPQDHRSEHRRPPGPAVGHEPARLLAQPDARPAGGSGRRLA